ncbi:hypothetical protein Mmc1_1676 [Magnetococcus marinus MC-1]|uniref:Uncharacterized protein n=1 Tax=Magnetococcus marinus (strain ATCC BAA-1437 / JCM 17883 / MC-1) TaxID=156889 RepID=A0L892_MAGMM|nr:hypothetical protein [Magnetococcus marinus]ABK44185.1 hypothetical protein Mmc1_1676 [Magnetococcus marinus MC-1]
MSDQQAGAKRGIFNIEVARGKTFAQEKGLVEEAEEDGRSPEEDWAINVNAVTQLSRAGQWERVFDTLVYLSTRESNPKVHAAMGQRIWVALKAEIPILDVTTSLSALQTMLGERHLLAGPLASLANLMCQHRGLDDPEHALAVSQVQQMFELAAKEGAGIDNDEGFQNWVAEHKLDQPDHFIPFIMEMIEAMVGQEWWFSREALQADLDHYQAQKEAQQAISS